MKTVITTLKCIRLDPELVDQLISVYRIISLTNGVPDGFHENVVCKLDDEAADNLHLPRFRRLSEQ
jgi:hypothetical protein